MKTPPILALEIQEAWHGPLSFHGALGRAGLAVDGKPDVGAVGSLGPGGRGESGGAGAGRNNPPGRNRSGVAGLHVESSFRFQSYQIVIHMKIKKYILEPRVSIALMTLISLAVNAETISISSAEYGDKWPFTVDSLTLSCRNNAAVLIQANTGRIYWLNGKASAQFKSFPSWREIAKPDFRYGTGAVMTPPNDMITRGLALCGR